MLIYTIGHSNYDLEAFVKKLQSYEIEYLVDIRGTPYSSYNKQYDKGRLEKLLKPYGIHYIYMGKEFAAQRQDKSLYTVEGFADFTQAKEDPDFLEGVERLKNGCEKGYKIALMGAMQSPFDCHRFSFVGRYLKVHGFCIYHILHEGNTMEHSTLEDGLIEKYCPQHNQLMLDVMTGQTLSREALLEESYRRANRAIGYRVEKLKR